MNLNAPVTTEILKHLDEIIAEEKKGPVNRASSANSCYRESWYKLNGFKGEPLRARAKCVFAFGDIVEMLMQAWIRAACVGKERYYSEVYFGEKVGSVWIQNKTIELVQYEQQSWESFVSSIHVPGHPDGVGKRNSDGQWELLEVKSAASFGYDRMLREGPGDYLKQAHVLMASKQAEGLGISSVRFFYLRKDTSHIWDQSYSWSNDIFKQVQSDFTMTNQIGKPDRPAAFAPIEETRYKKPTGKWKLHWRCAYCSMSSHCWPDAVLETKSGKPVYYVEKPQ